MFDPGDWVECVDAIGFPNLTAGKYYQIIDKEKEWSRIILDSGKVDGFDMAIYYRFRPVVIANKSPYVEMFL